MLLAFYHSRKMRSNNAEDDRQIHILVFLRMSNTNENKQLFNVTGGWETAAKNNPIRMKAIGGTQGKHNREGYWHRTSVC